MRVNQVFSAGLEWSNFAFGPQESIGSGARRSNEVAIGEVPARLCDAEWDAVVVKFLTRMVICGMALIVVSLIRCFCRQYFMRRYLVKSLLFVRICKS